jgi:Caspase domain
MKRRQFIQTSIQASSAVLLTNAIGQSPTVASAPPRSRKRALLVGINDYSHGNTPGINALKGCLNDVALLKNLLIYRYGFNPQDIITLTNAQATRTTILDQFQAHLLTASPDDTVVFAFSGHGSGLTDPYGKSDEDLTTGILPYDHTLQADGQANYITGTTLFLLRSTFQTENVTIVLDCCYAGGGTRGDSIIKSRQPSIGSVSARPNHAEKQYQAQLMQRLQLNPAQLNQYRQTQQGTKGILLAAAEDWQKASDATFSNHYNAGAFTKFLTETLWETPELPLDQLEQTVTQALIRFAENPQSAQTPVFSYPQDSVQLRSRPVFFPPGQFPQTPAQGTILQVDQRTRQITLWLGGLSSRALNLEAGAEFRSIPTSRANLIATLTNAVAADFTAIATIPPNQPLPQPGTLLQQYYRPLPQDLQLKLGLDPSLGQSVTLPPHLVRIKGITRPADRQFDGVDLIFSQMTPEYQRQLKPENQGPQDLPAIGSYGLFSHQLALIPDSFGNPSESIANAIDRLEPLLKITLIKKLFSAMSVTTAELAETPGIDARIYLKDQPDALVALPNQSKRVVKAGDNLTIKLDNNTGKSLESLMVAIAPSGSIQAVYPPKGKIDALLELAPEDGIGHGEILLLISSKPLSGIHSQLQELLKELAQTQPGRTSSRRTRNRSRSQIDTILDDLRQTPRSPSNNAINQLVISLPIRLVPKP